ncbi:MAG: sigma 54-interacting transcriptional regulator [Polyangiaceae bacterium]
MAEDRTKPTQLASPKAWERLGTAVAEGSSAWLFRASGTELVKLAKPNHAETLTNEARHALFTRCESLPELLGFGQLPEAAAPRHVTPDAAGVYSVWRYLPGADAAECALHEAALLKILRDVSRALATLHARGLCHGDVKPDNLRWDTESQRAWLLDLGLVAPLSTRIPRGATPRYLDPNLVEGRSSSGRDRDLYALGLTLLELALPAARSHRAPAGLATELPRSGREAQALASVIDNLLAPRSQHRPPARWLWREACHLLGEPDPALTPDPFRVESSYLWVRRAELLGAAHPDTRIDLEGAPREWVERCLELAVPLAPQCCESPAEARHVGPLSPRGRRAWLVELVGAEAANLRIPDVSEAELAARVLDHCQSFPAIMLGERELLRADSPERVPRSLQTLGLALSREPSLACLFAGVELVHEGDAEPELRVALASALRRRGEFATALSILNTEADLDSRAEHAETLRRMGDSAGASAMARATLKQLLSSPPDQDRIADRLRGTLARASLELGDVDAAEAALRFDPPGINALEARVLLRLRKAALGQAPLQPVETDLELAEVLAHGDEERARAQGLRGFFEHQRGNVERALRAFERAVEHSRRAGAPTEEATYLTGVAATATDCGKLGQAIQAAERASLMFGHFCELSRAARAQLNLGAALLATGAYAPAADAFDSAIDLATRSGDHGCQRAATLSSIELAVCRADSNPEQLPALAARVAEVNQRFVDASPAERLLLGALRLQADQVHRAHAASLPDGQVTASELPELEQLARDTTLPVSSRLEWWKARALMALDGETGRFGRPDAVLRELVALAAEPAPLISRGPALAAGAALAASLRSGDFARRLGRAAEHAASQLRQEVPEEYRPLTDELPWVKRLTSLFDLELAGHDVLAGAQLLKLEQLVRGLGVRGNLRALLNQVLDALVLWTGVERGLLLLKAPGNKLRVRAARNLSREDLSAHQRQLSMTLATRAVSAREPVVAVDALGELPELTESVHALNLRSVLAVPLVARGEVLGVVYLDDRDRRGAFGETELAWVRLLSSVASIAIAEARDQLLLRRAARQAERSKRRLEATLQDERRELVLAKRQLDSRPHPEIVGESPQMVELLRLIDKVAETSLPVLVYGESGTGKELVARAVHRASDRSKRGFVAENCAAVPESLLESTLFGHVKGAFTGADKNRVGLFELADGGSLFLDEIGEMSLAMQAKLLRVLERGEIRPVGAATTRRVDVRIIAATHRNLPELVKQGNFREDLFYRLDGFSLQVPALRERPGDVRLLCHHFLAQMAETAPKLSAAALRVLEDYSWPGNVRQLQNELRRATVLCDGSLRPEHLSPELRREAREAEAGLDLKRALELLERRLVGEALERTSGNQTRAAKLLGVSRFGLQKMIKRLEIDATGS